MEELELDPYGPRIIVKLRPIWTENVYIDASPDGVEAAVTLRAPRGLDPSVVEDEVGAILEEEGIGEYDVSYDPEEGFLNITLLAKLLPELPPLRSLAEKALGTLNKLQEKG